MTDPGATMRALLSTQAGPPETLVLRGDVPVPRPAAGEVLIRVEACGINYPDVLMIEDRYQFTFERPFAPGIEVAGAVEATGADVTGFAPGQRVVGQVDCGGLAERALVRAAQLHVLPTGVRAEQAAAMLLTYATSYHALRDRAALRAGETLLVLGAGGGVGLAAVELGSMMGARVVAAVSGEEKAMAARRAGADAVILYPRADVVGRALTAQLKAACSGGADVIYDPVGGDYAEPALRAIAWQGRYLVVGFAAAIPRPPLNLVLLKACQIAGVFWGAAAARDPAMARALVGELLDLVAGGVLHPPAPVLFPLERAHEALTALRDRTAVGKLVVVPGGALPTGSGRPREQH